MYPAFVTATLIAIGAYNPVPIHCNRHVTRCTVSVDITYTLTGIQHCTVDAYYRKHKLTSAMLMACEPTTKEAIFRNYQPRRRNPVTDATDVTDTKNRR